MSVAYATQTNAATVVQHEAITPDMQQHFQRAQSFMAQGDYASAKIEFEAVLAMDNLPEDLQQQVEIYAAMARDYAQGRRWSGNAYAMLGGGNYRVNPTRGTDAFGRSAIDDDFFNARIGGGVNALLAEGYAIDATLDYRYRDYADSERNRRDDKDLRWNAAISRSHGAGNTLLGVRGRASYRGNGQYRQDYGLYANLRYILDAEQQLSLGAELRRRQYPQGILRERSRNIAELSAVWTQALWDGKASLSLTARAGREHATDGRPDGDSNFMGLSLRLFISLADHWGAYAFGWWEQQRYQNARANLDAAGEMLSFERRKNDNYEVGAGLSWTFASNWSLNPELLYTYDSSNFLSSENSSTEVWLLLRRDFQF
ncbi:MAG: hypothetical protein AB1717_00900 [Pseudomonadota bacterium]